MLKESFGHYSGIIEPLSELATMDASEPGAYTRAVFYINDVIKKLDILKGSKK